MLLYFTHLSVFVLAKTHKRDEVRAGQAKFTDQAGKCIMAKNLTGQQNDNQNMFSS